MAETPATSAQRLGMYMGRVPVESGVGAAEPAAVSAGQRQLWSVVSKGGEPGLPFDDHAPLAPGTVVDEGTEIFGPPAGKGTLRPPR